MALASTPAQDRVASERAAYTGEPTARQKKAAGLIAGGKDVTEALLEAGYGKRFATGHAKTYAGLLVSLGLLDEKRAAKATPAPKAAAAAATTERETIR